MRSVDSRRWAPAEALCSAASAAAHPVTLSLGRRSGGERWGHRRGHCGGRSSRRQTRIVFSIPASTTNATSPPIVQHQIPPVVRSAARSRDPRVRLAVARSAKLVGLGLADPAEQLELTCLRGMGVYEHTHVDHGEPHRSSWQGRRDPGSPDDRRLRSGPESTHSAPNKERPHNVPSPIATSQSAEGKAYHQTYAASALLAILQLRAPPSPFRSRVIGVACAGPAAPALHHHTGSPRGRNESPAVSATPGRPPDEYRSLVATNTCGCLGLCNKRGSERGCCG